MFSVIIFFSSTGRFRQYGLWERYTELYPEGDLVYKIGVSDYRKDWFFAQVVRYTDTVFNIIFCFMLSVIFSRLENYFENFQEDRR